MGYDINISHQQTRDELGSESSVDTLFKRFSEKMRLVHGPTTIRERAITTSFILGHTINGVIGTSALGDYRESGTILRIENGNNEFNERFWTATFVDATTGTINYTTGNLVLDAAEEFNSTSIFYDRSGVKKISSITPNIPVSGTFNIYVSADGWETTAIADNHETILLSEAAIGQNFDDEHFDTIQFDNGGVVRVGSDLRISFENSGVSSVTIPAYSVAYTTYT